MTTEEGSKEEENDILKRIRMMLSKLQTTSSRIDKLRLESAEYSSQIDKSGLESAEEIEEIRTTEKQKVKECERQEMTEQDAELVNQEVKNKTINNVVAGNDEPSGKVLMPEIIMPAKTLENERAKLERKEMVKDKCDDQIFHPGEDIIERDDENQKEKLDTQDTNEPFQNHDQIQAEQKMNGRTGLEDLRIEFDKGKLASCADAYLRKETDKERNMNWSEEYGLKKIMLLNYTERGKQLRNSRN